MNAYKHFKGRYRAWLKPEKPQSVHTHTFYGLRFDAIEIRDVQSLDRRIYDSEKVGDYLYMPLLEARKKTRLGRVFQRGASDVVIVADEQTSFSENLEHVVLREHSGNRKPKHGYVRQPAHIHINAEYRLSEGEIYFSVLVGYYIERKAVEPLVVQQNPAVITAGRPETTTIEVPDLIVRPNIPTNNNEFTPLPGAAGLKGCFSILGTLLKWSFYLFLLFAFIGAISQVMRNRWQKDERVRTEDGSSESGKPRLNPKQDTLAPVDTWDYLTDHAINWADFISNRYDARYTTSSKQFQQSQRLHAPFANPQTNDALQYWNSVYSEFSTRDNPKLDSLTQVFAQQRDAKKLNPSQTAEMVITFIQEIPYCLIHDGTCAEASKQGGFIQDYHAERKPCLPNIIAGVQSPYEFIHTLKGDCDTRSLLAYTLLGRLGIPASIWVSDVYGHSVLGVGLGSSTQNAKTIEGLRHAAVELTAKGFRLGMLSPSHGNMNNWNIALFNNQ